MENYMIDQIEQKESQQRNMSQSQQYGQSEAQTFDLRQQTKTQQENIDEQYPKFDIQLYKQLSSGIYLSEKELEQEQQQRQQQVQQQQQDRKDEQQIATYIQQSAQNEVKKSNFQALYQQIFDQEQEENMPQKKQQAIQNYKISQQFTQTQTKNLQSPKYIYPSLMEESIESDQKVTKLLTKHQEELNIDYNLTNKIYDDYMNEQIQKKYEDLTQSKLNQIKIHQNLQIENQKYKSQKKIENQMLFTKNKLSENQLQVITKEIQHQKMIVNKQEQKEKILMKEQKPSNIETSICKKEIQTKKDIFSNQISHQLQPIIFISKDNEKDTNCFNIFGYEKQHFLKIQTLVYQIEIVKDQQNYIIKRRFADFVQLNKLIKLLYPGFIIYPFPETNYQLFTTLNLSMNSQPDKMLAVQKRVLNLQKYMIFLMNHKILHQSPAVQIFLYQNPETFAKMFRDIGKIAQQQQLQFEGGMLRQNYNTVKSLIKKGFAFLEGYWGNNTHQNVNSQLQAYKLEKLRIQSKNKDMLLGSIQSTLKSITMQMQIFSKNAQKLKQIYKSNSQCPNIQSNIDSVLILSSKISSSKKYYQFIEQWIQDQLLEQIKYYLQMFKTISEQVEYRTALVNQMNNLEVIDIQKGHQIMQRLNLFDQRFLKDWQVVFDNFKQQKKQMYQNFNQYWRQHCQLMSKIWK